MSGSLTPSILMFVCLLLAACDRQGDAQDRSSPPTTAQVSGTPTASPSLQADAGWELQSSDEGVALTLTSTNDATVLRLFCPAGAKRIIVNVPGFQAIASEERLSFGSGGEAVALVADARGDRLRGGVSGEGQVPSNLPLLVGGAVSASYGAQKSGPHPVPEPAAVRAFVTACREAESAQIADKSLPLAGADACMMQDDKLLTVTPLRALGTEPFWGAGIRGRCVTYSSPDDQKGTRIWTRFTQTADGGRWSGAFGGSKFELTTRKAPGCSDGMSDNKYPIAVSLTVNGEQRQGCAGPT